MPSVAGAYTPIPRAPFPVANTVASGQTLAGNVPLYCANRQVFAILQGAVACLAHIPLESAVSRLLCPCMSALSRLSQKKAVDKEILP